MAKKSCIHRIRRRKQFSHNSSCYIDNAGKRLYSVCTHYITIYVCTIVTDKASSEKYKKELGKLTKGITCIWFKKIEEINLETLKTVLKPAEKNPRVAGATLVDK